MRDEERQEQRREDVEAVPLFSISPETPVDRAAGEDAVSRVEVETVATTTSTNPRTHDLGRIVVHQPPDTSTGPHLATPDPAAPNAAATLAEPHGTGLADSETTLLLGRRCSSSTSEQLLGHSTGFQDLSCSSTSSLSSGSPKICRFCHDEESDVRGDRLIAPCLCMGSVKYVHMSCLMKWRNYSPTQAERCGSCQLEYRLREVDEPWKRMLRSRVLVPAVLLCCWVAMATLLGFAPVAHDNSNFGWHMLNGQILTGAVGLGVAGYELLSWRSATEVLAGVHGGWRLMRLTVWYIWRLYVLLCAALILFLGAYPWFFKAIVALIGIGWMQVRFSHLIWASLAQPTREVLEISDEERAQLLQQRREEEARRQQEEEERRNLEPDADEETAALLGAEASPGRPDDGALGRQSGSDSESLGGDGRSNKFKGSSEGMQSQAEEKLAEHQDGSTGADKEPGQHAGLGQVAGVRERDGVTSRSRSTSCSTDDSDLQSRRQYVVSTGGIAEPKPEGLQEQGNPGGVTLAPDREGQQVQSSGHPTPLQPQPQSSSVATDLSQRGVSTKADANKEGVAQSASGSEVGPARP